VERTFGGSGRIAKLIFIPVLAAQFYRSNAGRWVLFGFLASATVLLLLSWCLVLFPGLPWRGRSLGVPVKDYLAQSGIFVNCAFVLLHYGLQTRVRAWYFNMSPLALAGMFVASVGYVATARTAIMVFTVLLLVFGMRHFGWKGILGALLVLSFFGCLLWSSSGNFRSQILETVEGAEGAGTTYISISTGQRLEIWSKSVEMIMQAPLIGHGTGTIPRLFGVGAQEPAAPGAIATINPHSEIFRVGMQTGLLGIAVLIAMWISRLMLFRNAGSVGWIGTVVVVQNIVSSMFNSHISDFMQGWLYVFGVGVVGGTVLRPRMSSNASVSQRREEIKRPRS
jgi:O-antigen ligase